MKTIISTNQDPYFNLAWEEYILKNIHEDEDIFLLWQNTSSIVIGRNQNVFEEVRLDYLVSNHIPLIRRNSGGGTVYHDLGNINYSFITQTKDNINNYQLMTKKIRDALQKLNIDIQFREKSDMTIDGLKVSGNAQFVYKNKLLHHGTLLFDSNLEHLNNAIKQKQTDTDSIGVKSNRSTVTNIKNYTPLDINDFKKHLFQALTTEDGVIQLSSKDIKKIEQLKTSQYLTYQWNYGQSPKSVIKKSLGDYQIKVSIVHGYINEAIIMHHQTISLSLSASLVGERLFPTDLSFLKKKAPEVYQMLFT